MKFFFCWFFTVSNSITGLHFCSRFSWRSTIGTAGWMTRSSCLILRRFMLLIPKQNQLPELKFWWGYLLWILALKLWWLIFVCFLWMWNGYLLLYLWSFDFFLFFFVLATFWFWWITLFKQFSCRTMFPKWKWWCLRLLVKIFRFPTPLKKGSLKRKWRFLMIEMFDLTIMTESPFIMWFFVP